MKSPTIVEDDDDYSDDSDFSDTEQSPRSLARGLPKPPKEPPSPPQVAIKYRFQGSLRRANIQLPLSFSKLTKQISDSFPSQRSADLLVSYRDDENDTLVIATDEELQAAYDCFKATGRILLLDISTKSAADDVKIPAVSPAPVANAAQSRQDAAKEKRRLRIEKRAELRKLRAAAKKRAAAIRQRTKEKDQAKATAATTTTPIIATVKNGGGGLNPQPHQQAHAAFANNKWLLAPSTRVRIRISPMDQSRRRHNDKCGRVLFYDEQIGRYLVSVDGYTSSAETFSPEEITAISGPGSAIQFEQPVRPFVHPVVPPCEPRVVQNRRKFKRGRGRGSVDFNQRQRKLRSSILKRLAGTALAFAVAGCCGGFVALLFSVLMTINDRSKLAMASICAPHLSAPRTREARKRQRQCDFDHFQRNLYNCEGSELFQAIPFVQIMLIALSFIFGANWSMTLTALLSFFGLGVKALRAVCHCRANRACSNKCRSKIRKFFERRDSNEEIVCGSIGRHQLRRAFGVCLVAAAALVLVFKFPTPLFWITAFAPRIPQPVIQSRETRATATSTTSATSTRTVAAASSNATPISAATSTTTSSRRATVTAPVPASLHEARVTHLVTKIIAGIERAPLSQRGNLSDALARALGKGQRLGRDSRIKDFDVVKSMLSSRGIHINRS